MTDSSVINSVTITKPDDWHVHLRDNPYLNSVITDTANRFARAIVMPNLQNPIITADLARSYRDRILKALPENLHGRFEPLMTLYLTNQTTSDDIIKSRKSGFIPAVKWYPAGATTNSDKGVTDINQCHTVLKTMEDVGMILLVHGEVTDPSIDVFDREAQFIEQFLSKTVQNFPDLKIVFEHITTEQAVSFVMNAGPNVAATITAHHMLLNRNALFQGGIRPHHYCLPVLKREKHRQALITAATSDSKKFFLGTDSAPHTKTSKEAACGCAGIYTAHGAIELYAEIFDKTDALDKLEAFASFNGPDFYSLPRNRETIVLTRKQQKVPSSMTFGDEVCIPFRADGYLEWTLI